MERWRLFGDYVFIPLISLCPFRSTRKNVVHVLPIGGKLHFLIRSKRPGAATLVCYILALEVISSLSLGFHICNKETVSPIWPGFCGDKWDVNCVVQCLTHRGWGKAGTGWAEGQRSLNSLQIKTYDTKERCHRILVKEGPRGVAAKGRISLNLARAENQKESLLDPLLECQEVM